MSDSYVSSSTERPARPLTTGPDTGPVSPFPLHLSGRVIKGFGRGSKELGIPTANIPPPPESSPVHKELVSGIYYGFASLLHLPPSTSAAADANASHGHHPIESQVYDMVLSVGYNPFYNNTKRSMEVHLLLPELSSAGATAAEPKSDGHNRMHDFYGAWMNLVMLGFVRDERGDYSGVDELVEDIRFDMDVARRSLRREAYQRYTIEEFLKRTPTKEEMVADITVEEAGAPPKKG